MLALAHDQILLRAGVVGSALSRSHCPAERPAASMPSGGPRLCRQERRVISVSRVHFEMAAEHTGGVASKYDLYWTARLGDIRGAVARAADGLPAVVTVPGLTSLGDRQSWHGVAEVRGVDITRSSMAHATSLGRTVAASGLCTPWPETTFRFTIPANGDILTINADEGRQMVWPAALRAARQEQTRPRNATAAGQAHAKSDHAHMADAAGPERFNLALDELAEIQHGRRTLRDAHGTDGWPRHGVYFFYEPGEVRVDGRDRVVRVGTHALTATSRTALWDLYRSNIRLSG